MYGLLSCTICESRFRFNLPFLYINRQIRDETCRILYSRNTFQFWQPLWQGQSEVKVLSSLNIANFFRSMGLQNTSFLRNLAFFNLPMQFENLKRYAINRVQLDARQWHTFYTVIKTMGFLSVVTIRPSISCFETTADDAMPAQRFRNALV